VNIEVVEMMGVAHIPWNSAPQHLLGDRDRIFGHEFVNQVKALGIQQVLSAPRSHWLLPLRRSKRSCPLRGFLTGSPHMTNGRELKAKACLPS
jgi:hypothetical protein